MENSKSVGVEATQGEALALNKKLIEAAGNKFKLIAEAEALPIIAHYMDPVPYITQDYE
jgi:hypothetical protein